MFNGDWAPLVGTIGGSYKPRTFAWFENPKG